MTAEASLLSGAKSFVRRALIGIIGLAALAFGLYAGWFGLAGESATAFGASCFKVGIVLLCCWAAYPQMLALGRTLPIWIGGGMAFLILVVVLFPKSIYLVGPLIAMLAGIGVIWWMATAPQRKRIVLPKAKSAKAAPKRLPEDRAAT